MWLQLVLPENSNVGFAFALSLPSPAFPLFMALTPAVGGAAPF